MFPAAEAEADTADAAIMALEASTSSQCTTQDHPDASKPQMLLSAVMQVLIVCFAL